MDEISSRIKKIRAEKSLTQQRFAEILNLKQNTIATYEMGKTTPSDRTIDDICAKFNVNEAWLRTGEGEMFVELARDDEIAAFLGDLLAGAPDFRRRLVAVLARMSTEEWALLEKKITEIANEP